jgi:hypothetical protein
LLLCGLAHPTPSRRASENTLTARGEVEWRVGGEVGRRGEEG